MVHLLFHYSSMNLTLCSGRELFWGGGGATEMSLFSFFFFSLLNWKQLYLLNCIDDLENSSTSDLFLSAARCFFMEVVLIQKDR